MGQSTVLKDGDRIIIPPFIILAQITKVHEINKISEFGVQGDPLAIIFRDNNGATEAIDWLGAMIGNQDFSINTIGGVVPPTIIPQDWQLSPNRNKITATKTDDDTDDNIN